MTGKHVNLNIGGSLFALLGIVFIVLKLCHVIDWAWWLVLLPLYVPFVLAVLVLVFVCLWVKVSE
ncbi:hypothetical protein PMR98_06530 [Bifidobacterium longum]|jgi:hypothetical protein|uniref:hypothetical protein n=1 Tax=Bifidobacterium longum TaxID=216816 RepID=UPI0018A03929|nr:hypothetical protein [Bifidobacterium longum]MDB6598527.1 hypothetical protein [Bifidobacterium longum]MDB6600507.1 hypothetical protein [Bifidobacterium longum]MDB6795167.1 hypothetical protein [Bifidobacterium longum]MDB6797141.1 hypothetical protein [Bifidobacterium longum]MDB6799141.1 hypothetical protein [Bifidobacterium longum]